MRWVASIQLPSVVNPQDNTLEGSCAIAVIFSNQLRSLAIYRGYSHVIITYMGKLDNSRPVTVRKLKEIVVDAEETILKGVEEIFKKKVLDSHRSLPAI